MNGQRIKKIVGSATTEYTVQGKRVVHVKHSTLGEMHIYYDGNSPDMALYNGVMYRYVHSLQGDILGLCDSAGNLVVQYYYDAWGRQIAKYGTLESTLGTLNPLRYRGYVYDEDLGLYYLRSRYYSPWWGRFLSADSILGQVGGLLQHNLFAYCANSPVVFVDPDGRTFILFSQPTVLPLPRIVVPRIALPRITVPWVEIPLIPNVPYALPENAEAEIREATKYIPVGRTALRKYYKSRKEAYEEAKRAGKGREPRLDPPENGKGPHYHPNVANDRNSTPKIASKHDHYYFPKSQFSIYTLFDILGGDEDMYVIA